MINIKLIKTLRSVWLCLCLTAGIFCQSDAQVNWNLNPNMIPTISGTTYLSNSQNAVICFGNQMMYYPLNGQGVSDAFPIDGFTSIDAVCHFNDGNLLLFQDQQFRVMNLSNGIVDQNFQTWRGLPNHWNGALDAIVEWGGGTYLFFRGLEYVFYNTNTQSYEPVSQINNWQGWPSHWNDGFNSALNVDGTIYFFRGAEIYAYNQQSQQFIQVSGARTPALPPGHNQRQANVPSIPNNTGNPPANNVATTPKTTNKMEGWCRVGTPNNQTGWVEGATPLSGNKGADSFEDIFNSEGRVAEINIWSMRHWDSELIAGIQVILETESGMAQQKVLGRSSGQKKTITLDNDECISGLNIRTNGPSGNFIYAIQVVTTKKAYPYAGGKGKSRGLSPHIILMPTGTVFGGFKGTYTDKFYLTSIGLKYFTDDLELASTHTASTTGGESENRPGNYPHKYWDGYPDETKALENDTEWKAQPLPGRDWIGRGFDILKYDPLRPTTSRAHKSAKIFTIKESRKRSGLEQKNLLPWGAEFTTMGEGYSSDSSSWVHNYDEFTTQYGIEVQGEAGVKNAGKGSLSGSYTEMNSNRIGTEEVYHFERNRRLQYKLNLRLKWNDDQHGRLRQKLDADFENAIRELSDQPTKAECIRLITKYGTHFGKTLVMGGMHVARTSVKKSDFVRSRMTATEFKAAAEATIKKANVGGNVAFAHTETSTTGGGTSIFRRKVFAIGGKGETNIDKWTDKVDAAPVPVSFVLTPLADLLTADFFPTDPAISQKQELLVKHTNDYIESRKKSSIRSRGNFFKDAAPVVSAGNITIHNDAGYVVRFTLSYIDQRTHKKESKTQGEYHQGISKAMNIPATARNISVVIDFKNGFEWQNIKTLTFKTPEVVKYKVSGSIFDQPVRITKR